MADYIEVTEERLDAMRGRDQSESFDMINLLKFRPTVVEGLGIDGTSGHRAYFKHYAGKVSRIFERLGIAAELLHMNNAHATLLGLEGEEWDFVAIVRYPSRAEFLLMVDDPEFQEIEKFRTGSLVNSRLIESLPMKPTSDPTNRTRPLPERTVVNVRSGDFVDPRAAQISERTLDEATYMFHLGRFKAEADSGAGVDGLDGAAAFDRYISGLLDSDVGRAAGFEVVWSGFPLEPLVGPTNEVWDFAVMGRYSSRRQLLEVLNSDVYHRDHGPVRTAAECDSRLVETTPR